MDFLANLNAVRAIEPTASREAADREDDALREACRGVEGLFLGILLKEGLRTDSMNEEEAGFNETLREFAVEQTADEIGQDGGCGIADRIYEQLLSGAGAPVSSLRSTSEQKGLPHHVE